MADFDIALFIPINRLKLQFRGVNIAYTALAGVLLLTTFWEYRSDISYTRPAVLSEPRAVYQWFAQTGHEGPILELPNGIWARFPVLSTVL